MLCFLIFWGVFRITGYGRKTSPTKTRNQGCSQYLMGIKIAYTLNKEHPETAMTVEK
jgi:hypothetical protein